MRPVTMNTMFVRAFVVVACFSTCTWTLSMREVYGNRPIPRLVGSADGDGPGDPLFLSQFIHDGQLELAKSLSTVGPLKGDNVLSYSGYLTVNKTTESNLFFWFFPALKNAKTAPTILWLQGGPGGSSLFGLFVEHGPYEVTAKGSTRVRNSTWAQQFNMLYIDNPVGTGYSFTKSPEGYATTQMDVGRDLFEALQQFFTLFSEYSENDFYITGESYAGKYVPAIAHTIHENRDKAKMKLTGIAIGDGLCDPVTMLNYADFLQGVGLVDLKQAEDLYAMQNKTIAYIKSGDYVSAYNMFAAIMSYVDKVTGLNFRYNFLLANQPVDFSYYNSFVQTTRTRRALHVGDLSYNDGTVTATNLLGDFMKSVKPWVAELMEEYKVMIYNGQLDVIIAAPLTASFIQSIQWNGAEELAQADRIIWRNPRTKEPAGYVRQVRGFTEVLVRNAGHILPYDQPENAYDMIDRFIKNKPFN